jgi:hypothetical protein
VFIKSAYTIVSARVAERLCLVKLRTRQVSVVGFFPCSCVFLAGFAAELAWRPPPLRHCPNSDPALAVPQFVRSCLAQAQRHLLPVILLRLILWGSTSDTRCRCLTGRSRCASGCCTASQYNAHSILSGKRLSNSVAASSATQAIDVQRSASHTFQRRPLQPKTTRKTRRPARVIVRVCKRLSRSRCPEYLPRKATCIRATSLFARLASSQIP